MIASRAFVSFCTFLALGLTSCNAFNFQPHTNAAATQTDDRRAFLAKLASASLMVGGTSILNIQPAQASGGATAGGAYLLSAKQRYNERVIQGIKGFLALESSLKAGSVAEAQAYFAGTEVGTFGDISTAGYLLANAFRRNSTASPDSLPSVKVRNSILAV